MLHRLDLRKPDGRALRLYGRRPPDPTVRATAPSPEPIEAVSALAAACAEQTGRTATVLAPPGVPAQP